MENLASNSDAPIRPVDQLVLDVLRREDGLSVPDLMERLEVTATAIRQRLDRLEEAQYIERRKQAVGRGRPSFNYHLTDKGWRQAGVTYAELAVALWKEVLAIPDTALRDGIIDRISKRMSDSISQLVISSSDMPDRMRQIADVLSSRRIPTDVSVAHGLPVIEVHACPYPDLTSADHDRSVCELEQRVLSAALGNAVELTHCKLDGHGCCQFRPVVAATN